MAKCNQLTALPLKGLIMSKANKCLWFPRKLKRSGVSQRDVVYYTIQGRR